MIVVLTVLAAVVMRLLDVELGQGLLWVAGGAETLLVLFTLIGLYRLWRRRRGAPTAGAVPRGWDALRVVLREIIPERAAEAAVAELRMFVAALKAVTFRPLERPAESEGVRCFGAMASNQYGQLVIGLILVLAIEAPLVHLLFGAIMDEGPARTIVRAVFVLGSIYLAIWLIGDLRLLRESPGVCVGPQGLCIDLGLRVQGEVALRDITQVGDLRGRGEDVLAALARAGSSIRITPYPDPNVLIELGRRVSMSGIFGIPLSGHRLLIHVDDVPGLMAALRTAVPRPAVHEPVAGSAVSPADQ
jgi:hypothetical protein